MIKKGTRYLLLPLLFVSMCVCASALFFKPLKSTHVLPFRPSRDTKEIEKAKAVKHAFAGQITDFVIPEEIAPAVIDQAHGIIGIPVHAGQDITNLTPTITVTPGSIVTPLSGVPNDFTNAPLYTVDPLTTPVHYNVQVFHAAALSTCSLVPITLTSTTPTPAGSYQWQILNEVMHTWSTAAGPSTGADYTTQPINNVTGAPFVVSFRRAITTMFGTTYDSYCDVTVNPVIPITGNTIHQPSAANSTFCVSGDPGTIQGDAASGGDGNIQYQWQSSVGGGAFGNISGANDEDYAPGPISATTKFQRVVTAGDCNAPTTSGQVTITILPAIASNHLFPPGTTTFCITSGPLSLQGSNPPTGGSGTFSYQWQSSSDGVTFSDINTAAARQHDYNSPAITQTTYFRRMVSSGACSSVPSDNVIPIIIEQGLSGNNINPTGQTVFCAYGTPGTIKGDATTGGDGTPVYQWESSPDGGTYQPINGANQQNYDPEPTYFTVHYRRTVKSGSCSTPLVSAPVIITIQPNLGGGTLVAPSGGIHCTSYTPGPIQDTPPTGGDGNYTYTWQIASTFNGLYTDIPNTNVENYDPGTITQTTWLRRQVTCTGPCTTPAFTNSIGMFVDPPVGNNTLDPLTTNTFCGEGSPGNITGSTPTGGNGTYTYSWQQSVNGGPFTDIPFTDREVYSVGLITQTTSYRRGVMSGACNTMIYSDPVTVTIQNAITNNNLSAPANTVFCVSGSPGTISGTVPAGGDGTNYTYQWQSSVNGQPFTNIPNSNVQNYDPGRVTQTTIFQRTVTSGSCTTPAISNQVSVQIQPALANNMLTPPPAVNFCQTGDAGTILGSAATGGDGTMLYQWQQSPDNIDAHFTNIAGEIGLNFDPPPTNTSVFYRRVVTSGKCSAPLTSAAIEIHITPPIDPTSNKITPPLITNNCTSVDPATIIGNIPSGGDGPNSFQYQWEMSTNNGATWAAVASGGNAPDYDPPPITVSTMYHRNITSGFCMVPVTSNVVTLTIVDSPPNITINPSAPICAGDQAILSIASPDAALTYNWYDTPTKDNLLGQGAVFKTIALTTSQTFYAEASNGTCSSPQLAHVDVTVNPLPETPVLADAAPAGCQGSPAILKVASPQSGLTYKWYSAATGGPALFTGSEFTTPNLTGDVTYYVEAGNSSGCVSSSRAGAAITVYPLPVATAQGADICPGTIATLTANNPDPDQTINWYDVPTGGTPLGTGSSFTTPVLNSGKSYYAEAVNTVSGCISATRAEAKVQILAPLNSPVVHVTASVAPGITFTWAPVDGAVAYQVSIDNGASYSDPSTGTAGTSHTVTGLQIGQRVTIIVRALGNSSCETSADSHPVTGVTTDPDVDKIFVANAFTPNGDGKNDIVYVHNDNIKSLKFYVYDQWGNMLFESLSPQKGWDGSYKGKLQPVGVYVYYLEAVMNDGQPITKKGTITLLR